MEIYDNGSRGTIVHKLGWKMHIVATIMTGGVWLLYVPLHKMLERLP